MGLSLLRSSFGLGSSASFAATADFFAFAAISPTPAAVLDTVFVAADAPDPASRDARVETSRAAIADSDAARAACAAVSDAERVAWIAAEPTDSTERPTVSPTEPDTDSRPSARRRFRCALRSSAARRDARDSAVSDAYESGGEEEDDGGFSRDAPARAKRPPAVDGSPPAASEPSAGRSLFMPERGSSAPPALSPPPALAAAREPPSITFGIVALAAFAASIPSRFVRAPIDAPVASRSASVSSTREPLARSAARRARSPTSRRYSPGKTTLGKPTGDFRRFEDALEEWLTSSEKDAPPEAAADLVS